MQQRILTGVIGVPLLLLASYFGGLWITVVCLLLAGCAAFEYGRMVNGSYAQIMHGVNILLALLVVLIVGNSYQGLWQLALVGAAAGLYGLFVLLVLKPRFAGKLLAFNLAGSLYIGLGFGCLLLTRLAFANWAVILMVFLTTWITDTGAYFVGRRFGKHKLAPYTSPNKTIEGAVGGTLLAVIVVGAYAVVVFGLKAGMAGLVLLAIFLASAAAHGGDLLESALKRRCGVKDAGKILPGHGGVLDRFDSMLLCAPFLCLLMILFLRMA